MKIIVTGGRGFIGTELVKKLNKLSLNPIIIDLKDSKDIRNPYLEKIEDVRMIFHLAAKVSVPDSFLSPQIYYETNVWGTANLISMYPTARFVNISSSSAKTCLSPYAITKRLAETVGDTHCNCVNLRLFNVFGKGTHRTNLVIPNFASKMLNNEDIYIHGNGKQLRDFTYIDDVVEEIVSYGFSSLIGTHDIGYGKPTSIIDLFKIMAEYFNYNKSPIFKEPRRGDIQRTCANNIMLCKPIGFKKGLNRVLEWWKNESKYSNL